MASVHWTAKEVRLLRWNWAEKGIDKIAKELGRSPMSVVRKAANLKLGPSKRGKSMRQLARETGYAYSTIENVVANLKLKVKRIRHPAKGRSTRKIKHSHYSFDIEDEAAIIQYLGDNRLQSRVLRFDSKKSPRGLWGVGAKPPACGMCGTTERPHYAAGKCKNCYNKLHKVNSGWGVRSNPKACRGCRTTVKPPYASGRCRTCHSNLTALHPNLEVAS